MTKDPLNLRCPLCGTGIARAGEADECGGCGTRRGCRSHVCPRCGYHMPEEPPLLGWLRKVFSRGDRTP